jgi:transmembrane sensor
MDPNNVGPGLDGEAVDWEALARFLAGESAPGEADAVRGWLAENPDRHAVLRALDAALHRAADPPPAGLDVEAALTRVHGRMDAPETPVTPFRRPAPPSVAAPRWRAPALRAAAMVLLLLGAFFAWQVVRGPGGASPAVYATGVGERDSVRLSDGTRVLLGPGSRLALMEGYGGDAREVELRGEALFDVPHDDARPFIVHAGGARVRDIGTVFSVAADPDGGMVRVVVTDGAVAMRPEQGGADDELVLRQGERGVLAEGRPRAERAPATADDLAWTRGELVFRDAPLTEVGAEMRRWYGVELRAADAAVAGRRLTASFEGEDSRKVLEVIALALGAEMTMRGDTAVLSAQSAAR